jgi:hypothetical protein
MDVSFESLSSAISNEMYWSSLGYWILAIGLAGDIFVLVIPKHREQLEKILSAIFIVVIIVGVTIEHNADTRIAVLVSQQENAARIEIAKLKAPRIIEPSHVRDLIAKFRLYAGNEYWIITEKGDIDVGTEQQALAAQLNGIFAAAHWRKNSHWSRLDEKKTEPEFRADPRSLDSAARI